MTEQEIFDVNVPQATDSYAPISHQQIVEEIETQVDKTGLVIANKKYRVAQAGKIVTGFIDLKTDSDTFNYRLGFQNSYNKKLALAFVAGTSVIICSNGMIVGETKFVRRHTGAIASEMEQQIQTVITDLDGLLTKTNQQAEQMKSIELDPKVTAELCGRMFMEQEIITSSQLNIIKQQLSEPKYEDFTEPTLWSLYNHTTHALKKTHPYHQTTMHQKLHEFVEREFKL